MKIQIIIIYRDQSGCFYAQIDSSTDDNAVREICLEAVRADNVPGIDPNISKRAFRKHVVDRFHVKKAWFVIRPNVPFGSKIGPPFYCPFLHDRFFKTSKHRNLWPENLQLIRDDLHYHL